MTQQTFDPGLFLRNIVIVGCGGTGAQIARSVCRMVYDLQRRRQHTPIIHLIDPDRVEAANVGRQLFTAADVGEYKSVVLARRFNLALGLQVVASPVPVQSLEAAGNPPHNSLLVGAVDNHEARAQLATFCNAPARSLWLDCGNHHDSGQVIIGNTDSKEIALAEVRSPKPKHLPHAGLLFPSLLKPEKKQRKKRARRTAANCADDIASGEQALLINDLVATVASQYIYKLLYGKPITTFMTYIDADGINVRSLAICPENLEPYLCPATTQSMPA